MFDNETMFSIATYGVIVSALGLALVMAVRLWRNRPRRVGLTLAQVEPLTDAQQTLTIIISADVESMLEALKAFDRVVADLEQDEAFLRELALGNDVVRLGEECRAVREAWEIIAREMPRKNDNRSR